MFVSTEFDALVRLGIPDPSGYIKKRYKSNKLLFLRAACVGQALVDQVEASVEEAVSSATWTDIQVLGGGGRAQTRLAVDTSEFFFSPHRRVCPPPVCLSVRHSPSCPAVCPARTWGCSSARP